MKGTRTIILYAALLLCLASCLDEGNRAPEIASGEVEFFSRHGLWTYISLESGSVVGTSSLGDAKEDAAWALRKDWDIAVCDSLIRTNGGTSGTGNGAISEESASSAVPDSYQDIW